MGGSFFVLSYISVYLFTALGGDGGDASAFISHECARPGAKLNI